MDENGGVSVIIKSALFIAGNKLQTLFDNHIPEVSLKHFSNLNCFGIFLQEGTPEEWGFGHRGGAGGTM